MGSASTPRQRSRVVARDARVVLRTPAAADETEFLALRRASWSFLAPWEPDLEGVDPLGPSMFRLYLRTGRRHARLRMLVCSRRSGAIRGSITIGQIQRAKRSATVGYWIGERFARRGWMSAALRLAIEDVCPRLGVRELCAYVLPENFASKRLLAKLGFARRGTAASYRVMRGEPRDHERWVITCPSRAGSGNPG
jgi:ribosomal-protein-alanine N-acetyltransferase